MSNALNKYYKEDGELRPDNSMKYNKYLKNHLHFFSTSPHSGHGLSRNMISSNNKIDYLYWDDPNELIDRLRLLIGEREAGNNSLQNEIQAIIEELREAKIIY